MTATSGTNRISPHTVTSHGIVSKDHDEVAERGRVDQLRARKLAWKRRKYSQSDRASTPSDAIPTKTPKTPKSQ